MTSRGVWGRCHGCDRWFYESETVANQALWCALCTPWLARTIPEAWPQESRPGGLP